MFSFIFKYSVLFFLYIYIFFLIESLSFFSFFNLNFPTKKSSFLFHLIDFHANMKVYEYTPIHNLLNDNKLIGNIVNVYGIVTFICEPRPTKWNSEIQNIEN